MSEAEATQEDVWTEPQGTWTAAMGPLLRNEVFQDWTYDFISHEDPAWPHPPVLVPGFDAIDVLPANRDRWADGGYELSRWEVRRLRLALQDANAMHDTHRNAWHPFCRHCVAIHLVHEGAMNNAEWRDLEFASGADAIQSARQWLLRNASKPLPNPDASAVYVTDTASPYLTRDQLDDLPRPDPLIQDTLMRHSYALLVGRDSTFKTFVALDWALCCATGKPWQGRATVKVPVLFVAGEGAYGLAQRVDAWEYAWGEKVQPEQFTVRQSAVNLFRGGEPLTQLLQRIDAMAAGLVVIDTLATASSGANMQGSDSSIVLANIERIKRATHDGAVLVIAHTQKSDMDTSGLHQIEDDASTVWHSAVEDEVITITNRKQKDGPTSPPIRLATQPVLDSLVIQSASGPVRHVTTDAQDAILATLDEAFSESAGATKQELMAASGIPKSTFYRAHNALLKSGRIVGDDSKTQRFRIQSHPIPTGGPSDSHSHEGPFHD